MSAQEAITNILQQILEEYGGRLKIHGESDVLVSDPSIAQSLWLATENVRTPYGPRITVASRETPKTEDVEGIKNSHQIQVDKLDMNRYTHAVFGVQSEDPKYILQGLKHTIHALRPKGYAVVISLRQESKKTEDGKFQVSLEEKLIYQSKGRVKNLADVMEFAGFERGRVKGFEMTAKVGGEETTAEVMLAMKWDQLTG